MRPPGDFRHQDFPAGSMGPKVEAACTFVENTGRRATIGSLEEIQGMAPLLERQGHPGRPSARPSLGTVIEP